MAKTKESNLLAKVGSWAFLVGLVIALVIGFFRDSSFYPALVSLLIIMGLIVGLLNVSGHEVGLFLLAAISMTLVISFGGDVLSQVNGVGPYLANVLDSMMVFIIPATIVVALKAIFALAADD